MTGAMGSATVLEIAELVSSLGSVLASFMAKSKIAMSICLARVILTLTMVDAATALACSMAALPAVDSAGLCR